MDLAIDSTEQATSRLTYFRMAFGGAGSAAGHGFADADRLLRGYLASRRIDWRSEQHTSELQSLMRISYAVFCLKKNMTHKPTLTHETARSCTHITNPLPPSKLLHQK